MLVTPIMPLRLPFFPALLHMRPVLLLPLVFALTPLFFRLGFIATIHFRAKNMHVLTRAGVPSIGLACRFGFDIVLLILFIFFIHTFIIQLFLPLWT